MTTKIVAINTGSRLALSDEGELFSITKMLDGDGDITDDPTAAVAVIIKEHQTAWHVEMVEDFVQQHDK